MRALIALPSKEDVTKNPIVLASTYLLRALGSKRDAVALAEAEKASLKVLSFLKGVAATNDTTYGQVLADRKIAAQNLFGSVASSSIFLSALTGGMRRVPLGQRLGSVVTAANGYVTPESQVMPISALSLSGATMSAKKSTAVVALSNEVIKFGNANQLVADELVRAVTVILDAAFMDIAMVGATSFQASGNSAANVNDDLRNLLNTVNTTGTGRLLFAASPDVGNAPTILDTTGEMTPTGGRYKGIDTIVTSAVPSGRLRLLNAVEFAGDADIVELDQTENALIDLGAPPDSPPTGSTVMVSLFQQNMTAILARVFWGAVKLKSDACAELTGITWGDSP